jgi:predicted nucleic acid-binding protein
VNVVDSCGWLEFGQGGGNAAFFESALEDGARLIVPSLCLFEVHRHMSRHQGIEAADEMVGAMLRGHVMDLDAETALLASDKSQAHKLAAMDALIYATALRHGATFWTQDSAFEGLPGVKYRAKKG